RAQEDGVDHAARLGHFTVQLGMDGIERRHVEQPARQARLIAGHHHGISGLRQAGDGGQAAGQGHPFVGRLDEGRAVLVDDAVAIENDELHCASLEMSATWFIRPCNWLSSARRLARTAGSSAMTITSAKNASTGWRACASVLRLPAKSPACSCACAWGCSAATAAARACSAGSARRAASTAPISPSAFLSRLPMRLLAAARLAASGNWPNSVTARTRAATWCRGGATAM